MSKSSAHFPSTTASRLPPEVGRLVSSLWAGCDVVEGDVGHHAGVPLATFTALPNLDHPRLLVPTTSVRAARSALRQYNDGMSQLARIRKAVIGNAFGMGLGRLVGSRLHLFPGADPTSGPLLVDELKDLFGERLEIAIFFGEQLRPNRKPVLQLMTERGDVLGYAKVGWNSLTKRLVANEADALRSMATSPPAAFRVPRLLGETRVGDLSVTVVSPFPHRLLRRGALGAIAPYAATQEVASRGGVETGTLVGSDYERKLRRRIASVPDDGRRALLDRLFDLVLSEAAGSVLTFGSWHGDWSPWNMSRMRSGLVVWDWERSGRPVPVGLDVVHHRFHFRWRGGRESVVAAGSAARTESSEMLVRLGVSEPNHELLLRLYLLELMYRFEEGKDAGLAVSPKSIEIERALRERMAST